MSSTDTQSYSEPELVSEPANGGKEVEASFRTGVVFLVCDAQL